MCGVCLKKNDGNIHFQKAHDCRQFALPLLRIWVCHIRALNINLFGYKIRIYALVIPSPFLLLFKDQYMHFNGHSSERKHKISKSEMFIMIIVLIFSFRKMCCLCALEAWRREWEKFLLNWNYLQPIILAVSFC